MKILKFLSLLIFSGALFGSCSSKDKVGDEQIRIIPLPNYYQSQPGVFEMDKNTVIGVDLSDTNMVSLANYLNEKFMRTTGFGLSIKSASEGIVFTLVEENDLGEEGYRMSVTPDGTQIYANTYHGIFNGIQSFLQLLPLDSTGDIAKINCIDISDKPRFAWRGLMLDVSRHFFTKQEVKRFIDLMAEYKYNVFHWHLSDDQGWRVEIKSLPRLTDVGAWRAPRVGNWWEREPQSVTDSLTYGGFYTQDDIREVVEYARERFITVVPEIDVPGHSMALLTAYPEISCTGGPFHVNVGNTFYTKEENSLCVGKEKTFAILDMIFDELVDLFPSSYIHIGLAKDAIVMSWRGMKGGVEAARQGHRVIMTPFEHCYLDLYQGDPAVEPNTYSMLRLRDCYKFSIVPDSIDASFVLGGQGNLWAESIPHYRQVEYMTWPRAMAISETLWNETDSRNWDFFIQRVESQFRYLDRLNVNYARSIYDPIISPSINDGELKIELTTEISGLDIFYTFDNTNPDCYSNLYTTALTVPKNATMLKVVTYRGKCPIGKQINLTIEELKERAKKKE